MDFVEGVGRGSELADSEYIGWVKVGNRSLNGRENNVLLRNLGGAVPSFVDQAYVAGADRGEDGRGVGILDIDSDGDLDLIVQSAEKPTSLLVNLGDRQTDKAAHWLQIRLRGTRSNRDASGARVEVHTGDQRQIREVTSTGGYISGRSLLCHFGLGRHTVADSVQIHWPAGGTTTLKNVTSDQLLTITEPTETGRPGR